VIQRLKELSVELEVPIFADAKSLDNREVYVGLLRASQNIATYLAEVSSESASGAAPFELGIN